MEQKVIKWNKHNEKLIECNQQPITYQQWDITTNVAVSQYVKEEQEIKTKVHQNIKNNTNIAELIASFGGFYFNCYKQILKLEIQEQHILRFVYLCTFINYKNKLEFGNAKSNKKLALEKDLKEMLDLSERETRITKKALIDNGLITINEDKTITINKKYCIKGKISKTKLIGAVRIMEKGIKDIYNKATAKEHKRLAILIELLPYVNFQHNIFCWNPTEENITKIEPMNLKDLCRKVGYDDSNQTRLKRELLKITVDNEYAICIVLRGTENLIYINPKIYYKGTDYESLKALINIFKIGT